MKSAMWAKEKIAASIILSASIVGGGMGIMFTSAFAQNKPGATSATVVTYPRPQGIPASDKYAVRVNGRDSFTYKSDSQRGDGPRSASWTTFAFSKGAVSVEVTNLSGPVNSVVIRPRSFGIVPKVDGNRVMFDLAQSRKVFVEINGGYKDLLFIFGDAPEVNPPNPGDPDVIYFGPGVHDIGANYAVPDGKTLYIAGGAVVYGTIRRLDRPKNVTICGRGILSGRRFPHVEGPGAITFQGALQTTVKDITVIESPGFCVSGANTFSNLKIIGWYVNTDGIQLMRPKSTADDCFIFNHDDGILLAWADGARVSNCVIYCTWSSAFQVSWNVYTDFGGIVVRNCDVIHCDPGWSIFSMQHGGKARISDLLFEHIRIENPGDQSTRLIDFKLEKNAYAKDEGLGNLSGVRFKDIDMDVPTGMNRLLGMDAEHRITDITFENFKVKGKVVRSAQEMGLEVNPFVSGIHFMATNTPPGK